MNDLSQSKSNLAKLLAEENITIEQKKGAKHPTFNPVKRLLTLPILDETASPDIIDLFISHEVGHALYSPECDILDVLEKNDIRKSVLNVVEDARIERFIKSRYPGLKPIYFRGYNDLKQIGFMRVSGIDLSKLNLIDKINYQTKFGFVPGITFDEEEQAYLDKVENTLSFDDVICVSKEIMSYMRKKHQEQTENEDYEEGDFYGDQSENDELEESREFHDDYEYDPTDYDPLESSTQNMLDENIRKIYSDSNLETIYVDLPEYDTKNYVADFKIIEEIISPVNSELLDCISLVKEESKASISYMIKEFMLKKDAEKRKYAKISKTGKLNLSKLYAYTIEDDIFQRLTTVRNGKSHGLVFFLDWSGSMARGMLNTVKQVIILTLFCKKMNIPFEVYAFTSSSNTCELIRRKTGLNQRIKFAENEMILTGVGSDRCLLMNFLSSRMNNMSYNNVCNFLLSIGMYYYSSDTNNNEWEELSANFQKQMTFNRTYKELLYTFDLTSTPLIHTVMLSKLIVEEFKEKTKTQIVNAIYLTDGESNSLRFNNIFDDGLGIDTQKLNVYLRDKKSGITHFVKKRENDYRYINTLTRFNELEQCVKFMKKIVDFKMFTYRICSDKEFVSVMKTYGDTLNTKIKAEYKANKCYRIDDSNFDHFYFVNVKHDANSEELDIGEAKTAASIAKKFAKCMNTKMTNKIFLKKFIEFMA